jgi:hypothetical protein
MSIASCRRPSRRHAVVLAAAFSLGPALLTAQSTLPPDEYVQLGREIFEELIEINTTHSVGNTTIAAEAMATRLVLPRFSGHFQTCGKEV